MSRRLRDVVEGASLGRFELLGEPDVATIDLTAVDYDSRNVQPGSLFCCLRGANSDGHEFAQGAREAGAVALLVDHRLDLDVAQIVVDDTRRAMGWLAASFFGHPSRSLTMVGVTGTNGKTTTTSLITSILTSTGRATGMIGTLTGTHTTPEAPDLQAVLADFVA
ncbi:MAG TPA: Mur ligase domain-containing protein, partial [Ilumatobacteraceae bacterium]|nr:Mur ligase domain-containing protein [Ilumatobacteraceae bacterium]